MASEFADKGKFTPLSDEWLVIPNPQRGSSYIPLSRAYTGMLQRGYIKSGRPIMALEALDRYRDGNNLTDPYLVSSQWRVIEGRVVFDEIGAVLRMVNVANLAHIEKETDRPLYVPLVERFYHDPIQEVTRKHFVVFAWGRLPLIVQAKTAETAAAVAADLGHYGLRPPGDSWEGYAVVAALHDCVYTVEGLEAPPLKSERVKLVYYAEAGQQTPLHILQHYATERDYPGMLQYNEIGRQKFQGLPGIMPLAREYGTMVNQIDPNTHSMDIDDWFTKEVKPAWLKGFETHMEGPKNEGEWLAGFEAGPGIKPGEISPQPQNQEDMDIHLGPKEAADLMFALVKALRSNATLHWKLVDIFGGSEMVMDFYRQHKDRTADHEEGQDEF